MRRSPNVYIVLLALMPLLFIGNIAYGAVSIPLPLLWDVIAGNGEAPQAFSVIITGSRIPQALTALLSGAALAVSGLLLQTFFRNPLAGPSILGISDGANLGVAIVMLCGAGAVSSFGGYMAVVFSALAGALTILAVIIYFSKKVRSNVMLLIIGMMTGYMVSSAISVLNYYASADKVRQFVMWGMGDFSSVSLQKLPYFSAFLISGLAGAVMLIKPLNALLLGDANARSLGINVRRTRLAVLLCTGVMTAVVTAFCGPISFIGLAVPHVARLLCGTSDHRRLVPVTILCGACVALLCNMMTVVPGSGAVLPLNAVTPLLGAPVIIYVIVNKRNIQYFD